MDGNPRKTIAAKDCSTLFCSAQAAEKRGRRGTYGNLKKFSENLKKGVDICGGVCYYMQAVRERAARHQVETKKFWEKRKKVLTSEPSSDIMQKLFPRGRRESPERFAKKKLQKIFKKGLDKPIRIRYNIESSPAERRAPCKLNNVKKQKAPEGLESFIETERPQKDEGSHQFLKIEAKISFNKFGLNGRQKPAV